MAIHTRRHKTIQFTIDAQQFECQIQSWQLDPGAQDGDRIYTLCADGADIAETDEEPTLQITYYADWRTTGLSDYLWANRGKRAQVQITHHPDLPEESVQFSGEVVLRAPAVGGEARSIETQEVTFQVVKVDYARTGGAGA